MKKIFILPFCLMSTGAIAATTFYYDTNGVCDGLFVNPNATSCGDMVKRITPPTFSDRTFLGYYAGTTKVIDKNGNILISGYDAARLFNNTDPNDGKKAEVSLGGGQTQIEVRKYTTWGGDDTTPKWYYCSGVQRQYCDMNDKFYVPYAPHCWNNYGNPAAGQYNFVFNSWGFKGEADHTTNRYLFTAASQRSLWVDCLPNQNSNPSCNSGTVSFGDSYITGGCNTKTLDTTLDNGNYVSNWKVFPFACELLYDTEQQTWTYSVAVPHGHITLDNKTPGQCVYTLTCDYGFWPSDSAYTSWTCGNTGCRNFTNGTVDSLRSLGLTATCVQGSV